jgi:hypothetical protein
VAVSGMGEVGEYPESNRKQYSPTKRSQKQATFTSIRGCFTPKQMFCDHFLCFLVFCLYKRVFVCACTALLSLCFTLLTRGRELESKKSGSARFC